MTSLVAGPRDIEQSAFAGTGLLEDIDSTCAAIANGDWVAAGLGFGSVALSTLAAVIDPIGEALAAGIGWVIEHLDPLKDWLQKLTGDDEAVAGFADTWINISRHVDDIAQKISAMQANLSHMSGDFIDAVYKELGTAFDSLSCLSRVSSAVGMGFEIASSLVSMVYGIVRDAIADIVAKAIVWVAELVLTLGLGTPVVITQVVTTVSKWVGNTFPKLEALTESIISIQRKAGEVQTAIQEVTNVLGKRTGADGPAPGATAITDFANDRAGDVMTRRPILHHLFDNNTAEELGNILAGVDKSSVRVGNAIADALQPSADLGFFNSLVDKLHEDGQSAAAEQIRKLL